MDLLAQAREVVPRRSNDREIFACLPAGRPFGLIVKMLMHPKK